MIPKTTVNPTFFFSFMDFFSLFLITAQSEDGASWGHFFADRLPASLLGNLSSFWRIGHFSNLWVCLGNTLQPKESKANGIRSRFVHLHWFQGTAPEYLTPWADTLRELVLADAYSRHRVPLYIRFLSVPRQTKALPLLYEFIWL